MNPLEEAVENAWATLGDRTSLIGVLPPDAVLVRARDGERRSAVPRMLELLIEEGATADSAAITAELAAFLAEGETSAGDRRVITDVLDLWWSQTLMFDPPVVRHAGEVLSILARLDEPMVRWLGPWLADLDGASARHLGVLIRTGLDEASWSDQPDAAMQVRAWARSEPVVFGLALVGGTHLADGELSDLLDVLVMPDEDAR